MNRKTLLTLAGLLGLALIAGLMWLGRGAVPAAHDGGAPAAAAASPAARGAQAPSNPSSLPTVKESALPAEAQSTLRLIAQGGPYPYSRDGINFGNFEGALPKKSGGYYKEYTVPTPGSKDRGARRIIVGSAHEKYYTADHYATFRFILEGR